MGQSVNGYFGYGIFINSPESDANYYSRLKSICEFFNLDYKDETDMYDEFEYNVEFRKALSNCGLELVPQYSYESKSFCLIVKRSLVISYEDPEVVSVRHIQDRTGYEIMDKLADHLGCEADYIIWGFCG